MPKSPPPDRIYPRIRLSYFNKLINLVMGRLFVRRGLDLTREQEAILRELRQGDGINQAELAARTGQDRNNLSRTLGLLAEKSLVRREVCATDRRNSLVFLTPAGRVLQQKAYLAVNDYRAVLFQGFSQREIDAFANSIQRLSDNLEMFLQQDESR